MVRSIQRYFYEKSSRKSEGNGEARDRGTNEEIAKGDSIEDARPNERSEKQPGENEGVGESAEGTGIWCEVEASQDKAVGICAAIRERASRGRTINASRAVPRERQSTTSEH